MATIRDTLKNTQNKLYQGISFSSDEAKLEARFILEHVLKITQKEIIQKSDLHIDTDNQTEIKYITEIRDFAKAENVKLILGTVPKSNFDERLRATVKSVARDLGIQFIQGNDALGSGEFFQDGTHLNYQGSVEFSKFLGVQLGTKR